MIYCSTFWWVLIKNKVGHAKVLALHGDLTQVQNLPPNFKTRLAIVGARKRSSLRVAASRLHSDNRFTWRNDLRTWYELWLVVMTAVWKWLHSQNYVRHLLWVIIIGFYLYFVVVLHHLYWCTCTYQVGNIIYTRKRKEHGKMFRFASDIIGKVSIF